MEVLRIKDTVSGPGYDIAVSKGFIEMGKALSGLDTVGRRALIVSDETVSKLYSEALKEAVSPCFKEVSFLSLPPGEEHKNLDNVRVILNKLISLSFDRHDFVIALGGGVIGDMAGFASAVYLRGIRVIQVPTTLLSQTDSSIGGKTGVDVDGYKNMAGAFHQPSYVHINVDTLLSLDERQFKAGMGEIIKHGLIRDAAYYEWLRENKEAVLKRDTDILSRMIKRSLEIKAEVVEEDPTEKGLRAILNFGHTIGHAIEKYYDFSLMHGECVGLGMVISSNISLMRENILPEEYEKIRDLMGSFGLPLYLPDKGDPEKILKISKADKKMDKGKIKFILLKKVGEAFIDDTVTDEEILSGVKEVLH